MSVELWFFWGGYVLGSAVSSFLCGVFEQLDLLRAARREREGDR